MAMRVAIAVAAGLIVVLLLFPASGIDPIPPRCFSIVGYEVPCAAGVAWIAGIAAAGLVFAALWLSARRVR
jgi:hypothetical protein